MNLFTAMSIGSQLNTPWVSSFQPESEAIFAAMVPSPSPARKTAIDQLVVTLKNGAVWANLDCLEIFAAHSQQAASLNWIAPTGGISASLVGGAFWTVDSCYGNVNTAGSGVNTGFTPSGGVKYQLADSGIGYYVSKIPTLPAGSTSRRTFFGAMDAVYQAGETLPWHEALPFARCLSYRKADNRLQVAMNHDVSVQTMASVADNLGTYVIANPAAAFPGRKLTAWLRGDTSDLLDVDSPLGVFDRPSVPVYLGAVALSDGIGGHVVQFPSNAEFAMFYAGKRLPVVKRQIIHDAVAAYLAAL